ncbi:hypothetical protein D1872_215610 [compost metagenome]
MVDPAQVLDVAVWHPARQISGTVHPFIMACGMAGGMASCSTFCHVMPFTFRARSSVSQSRFTYNSLSFLRLSHFSSHERIRHELLCRQLRTIQIAAGQTRTGYAQLACYADRCQMTMSIHDVDPVIRHRTSDRDDLPCPAILRYRPDGCCDRILRWTITVVIRHLILPLVHQLRGGRRSGCEQNPQTRHPLRLQIHRIRRR